MRGSAIVPVLRRGPRRIGRRERFRVKDSGGDEAEGVSVAS